MNELAPFKRLLNPHQIRTLCSTLRLVDRYLTSIDKPYFLTGGALMGFTRYGCIMPWDDDVDLHCYGALAIDPFALFALGLEVKTTPHSIQFRRRDCRMLVEVLPLGPGGTITFHGKTYTAGDVETERQLFMGVEISVPKDPYAILDGGYGTAWRNEAVPPKWDHVKRRPRIGSASPVPLEKLDDIVLRFKASL